ncbi:flavin-containing monooxygenase [Micromonospora echinofusca]|uniref:NAD(P)-binding domain-containing protein n=1 Tax=Micromonospora echinofusca TaxID=47858 RepID=A0ABS3VNM6_MICEH|nr:NAD(P)-binding domain-containing protein [Micromonospora echinofusca]MBO4206106.1 NAD(P)-binding domain-containing protein [Micromonospora echinofusca]
MLEKSMDVIVIGGGQAGVSVGHYLNRSCVDTLIVDGGHEIGQSWRRRWDSLRLFTAAKHNNLPGTRFPGDPDHIPGKNEMADYLVDYVRRFDLPVRLGVEIDHLTREGDRYVATAGEIQFVARQVVVATGPTGEPRVPAVANELDPGIVQVHSADYRNPTQLPDGPALVVGAGNSGAEIAIELAATRDVWLAGPDVGKFPFNLGGPVYKMMNRAMTRDTPWGRKIAAKATGGGTPLVRLTPEDVTNAGVRRVGRLHGVVDGQPKLDDGAVVRPASIVWCTGFTRDHGWIKLPIFDETGEPRHHRGVVAGEPGLYFLGLPFLHTMASSLIMGVTVDAEYTAKVIRSRC